MKIDKKCTYAFASILLFILLICVFFISNVITYIIMAIMLTSALLIYRKDKVENITYSNRKKILKTLILFGLLYVSLFYMTGLYVGYVYQKIRILSFIPFLVIIASTEFCRNRLLKVNDKKIFILVLIITTLVDIIINGYIYDITKLNGFLSVVGYVSFSSIANNLLYNYLSPKYGYKPILVYRIITSIYLFIFPVIPDLYIFFRVFIRMLYPLLIYEYVENNLISRADNYRNFKKTFNFLSLLFILFIVGLIAIISCQFDIGAVVIGSSSMVGYLDKGDVIVYVNEDKINVGDVIVFKQDKRRIVHRVVKEQNINGETRYYTKGDANQEIDEGYILNSDYIGTVKYKIKDIGKPTLWLREKFK